MSTTSSNLQSPLHLRVFLSSPGDVTDERALAREVIERIQSERAHREWLRLEIIAWDKPGAGTAMPAHLEPQEALERGLRNPSACEIVIVIFGYRMGTPLSEKHCKPNGERYWSGTEYEFLDALNAARQKRIPDVLVYRKQGAPDVNLDDPQFEEKKTQWQRVKDFFATFKTPDGAFRSYYKTYEKPSQFKEMLDEDLRDIVARYLEKQVPAAHPPSMEEPIEEPVWHDSPYPGLRAFRTDEAPIFFGRDRETDELVENLSDPRNRLIVVVGASGSGKSSLIAAGLLPRLQKNAIPGSEDWILDVRFTPGGEVGDNPFMALAMPFKETLQQQGQTPRDFTDRLEKSLLYSNKDKDTGRKHLAKTLTEWRDLALAGKPAWAELLLFIDQFEELFTLVAPRYVGPFVDWLGQAVQTERIRVVATLRADFYHRCVEHAVLAKLFTGSYNLAAPGPGALHEMITRPAERAGLTFEAGLIDQILTDTGAEPGALALLAFALADLYSARTTEGRLTREAYEGFNGVQGAIAKRAEDTFNTLDADAQAALSDVFRELVKVDERGVATRRRAARRQVSQLLSATERLIDRFTNARLLVTSGEKEPAVEVAHEALLRSWPRLVDWIESVRDDLHLRSQLQRDAKNWAGHNHDDNYCWTDERVVTTRGMLERLSYLPSELEREFLGPIDPQQMRVLVKDLDTPAKIRRTIGIRMALLGDLRPGIGLGAEGPLDFRWASIPGTEAVRASGRFPSFTGFRLGTGARIDLDPDANVDETWPEKAAPLEINPFELAIYPVTVAQFRPFVEQGGYQDDRYWSETGRRQSWRDKAPGWWTIKIYNLPNQPVIGVTWYAVEAYCNWLNDQLQLPRGTLRLLTEAEWEWAARGPEGRRYPWGDDWDTRRCNSLEAGLECTSVVGCFPGGAATWWLAIRSDSAVVYDLAGNVSDWTASQYSQDYSTAHQSVLNTNHSVDRPCVLRGGTWASEPRGLRGAARDRVPPRNWNNDAGFRLARTFP